MHSNALLILFQGSYVYNAVSHPYKGMPRE
jgi:hypothetical protein